MMLDQLKGARAQAYQGIETVSSTVGSFTKAPLQARQFGPAGMLDRMRSED